MIKIDGAQWAADTERLYIAALSRGDGTQLDYDTEMEQVVQGRCVARFGQLLGRDYFRTLVATLPDTRPELFPELVGFNKI